MAKDPAVLFYYQDFLVGTEFMEDEDVGKYIRILCHQFDKGKLTERQVLSICKASAIENIEPEILIKLKKDNNGLYYNERAKLEKEKRANFSKSRRDNALGIKSKKASAKHMEDKDKDVNKDKKKKHKYGEYKNVLLTDIELQKIKDKFPNWEELIKKIDEGIEMKGYKYKSHYLAIVNVWSKNDKGDTVPKPKKEVNYYLYRCPVCQKEFRKREKKAGGVGGYECDEKKCQELLTNNQYRGHYLKLKDIILKKDQ